ncbi:glutathione S-transferase N-terminal domain-containing protein [Aestuariibacter sp. AA17]|uniref:Glutathione S-transferase N-terminal domain-containing protein n=1 Tax=Fluctibacter corallii TaxID=2984329 RepID=A0ABT3ACF1_9ALTE|nr:glutathione S-transferase N-terminal domain-containing protein [Aestuariibacter sp. AA17]MCV2886295.1 glutathione S-transferase N-terminal domain-containing protein [Aestuariibacter sp. AA17]
MIELYTAATPNGWKASVALEEMQLEYVVKPVNLMEGEQKTDMFLSLNPNGRIPVIVDKNNGDFVVFESGAIMLYLAEMSGKFLPTCTKKRSKVMQWLMFQMAGVGPMMGQANVFYRYFPEKIQPAIDRYQNEVSRLLKVLDTHLNDHEYLVDDYSIADMANWCWVRTYGWSGVSIDDMPNLNRWRHSIESRPLARKGVEVPGKIDKDKLLKGAKHVVTR